MIMFLNRQDAKNANIFFSTIAFLGGLGVLAVIRICEECKIS
jgi:hypothetical protein